MTRERSGKDKPPNTQRDDCRWRKSIANTVPSAFERLRCEIAASWLKPTGQWRIQNLKKGRGFRPAEAEDFVLTDT